MKILLPTGYEPPENARPGEPFEAVARIQPGDDGSFTLVAIDGVELGKEAVEEEEELNQEQKLAKKVALPWNSESDTEY